MSTPDRDNRNAAITLALTLPTDTVLYLLLPLHAAEFGVTLAEAGLLLAANRLVRIVGYGWVARLYAGRGTRAACLMAVAASVASSLGYALAPGVVMLLAARLAWGLAFAALNIATQDMATRLPQGAARRSGTSRAIVAAGPMLCLVAGALATRWVPAPMVFLGLAALAACALPFAAGLPAGQGTDALGKGGPRFSLPGRMDVWGLIQGITLEGLYVFALAILAAAAWPEAGALAAGAALASRYLAEILLGRPAGALAERFGALRVLIVVSLGSAAALAAIGLGALWLGVAVVVVLRGILQPLPPPVIAAANPGPARVPALARQATWRDIGAGLGPLLAGMLLPVVPVPALFLGAAGVLALASLGLARPSRP
ncbi:MFS transporter [Rhodovarius crocodyli]|uniref:MFS transporter n=1 Tax=Rhodovarius crocodyli TaxID=1979269 RepID=A0A437M2J3_9PROT|nr:MFS transporter [Rhodovarius crocodyli]RVT91842.1 MFS transporter [Rhodovarius crocodyli]